MNTIGYKCPKCGKDNLQVKKELWCQLNQSWSYLESTVLGPEVEITIETPYSGGGVDDTDEIHCNSCGYAGKATLFEWSKGPPGTITVNAEKEAPA